jgi:hypothetical protein
VIPGQGSAATCGVGFVGEVVDNALMGGEQFGANVVTIAGQPMLLAQTGGGTAMHLVRAAASPDAQAAVDEYYLSAENLKRVPTAGRYGRDDLLAPGWAPRTLCGRGLAMMACAPDTPTIVNLLLQVEVTTVVGTPRGSSGRFLIPGTVLSCVDDVFAKHNSATAPPSVLIVRPRPSGLGAHYCPHATM